MGRFYSVTEAAEILGVTNAAIYRLHGKNVFKNVEKRPAYGIRGGKPRLYISEEDIESQLEVMESIRDAGFVEPKYITEEREKQKKLEEDYVKNPDKYITTVYGKIIGINEKFKEVNDEMKETDNDFYTEMDKILRSCMTVSFKPDAVDGIIDEIIKRSSKEQLTKCITKMMERLITM